MLQAVCAGLPRLGALSGDDAGGGESVYKLIPICMVWTNLGSKIDLGVKRDTP